MSETEIKINADFNLKLLERRIAATKAYLSQLRDRRRQIKQQMKCRLKPGIIALQRQEDKELFLDHLAGFSA